MYGPGCLELKKQIQFTACKDHLDKQREGKLDLLQDQDQQYKISVRIGGKLKGWSES